MVNQPIEHRPAEVGARLATSTHTSGVEALEESVGLHRRHVGPAESSASSRGALPSRGGAALADRRTEGGKKSATAPLPNSRLALGGDQAARSLTAL